MKYSDKLKRELDKRYADYKNGNAKVFTTAESKEIIQKLLNKDRQEKDTLRGENK